MNKWLAEKLLEIEAIQIRDENHLFTWASGIKSPVYCDNRLTLSYPEIRSHIAEKFVEKIKQMDTQFDVIVGAATGGIAHAALVAEKLSLPMAYVRSSAKSHGKKNAIEGRVESGDKVLVIEDTFSTAGSAIKVVQALKEVGASVEAVLSIFTYGFNQAAQSFESEEVHYNSLLSYAELLEVAVKRGDISKDKLELLSAWSTHPRMFTT